MKKIILMISSVFIFNTFMVAQDSLSSPKAKEFPSEMENQNGMDGFKDMQRQMMQFFGKMENDSSRNFAFQFDTSFMKVDTSFSKSFGFSFDGENWQSLTPNTERAQMGEMFKQLQEQMKKLMPDMNKDFDMSEMLKGFGNFFDNDFSTMPRVQPKDKKRLGEEDTKNKKYKTEKL